MAPIDLDPDVLSTLRVLHDHQVEHVVIGDVADAIHEGGAGFVDTLAIVPSGYARNLERLSTALRELDAELRVAGESQTLPVDLSAPALRDLGRCTLATEHADVELDVEPAGTAGYHDLYADARPIEVGERLAVQVASSEDLDRIEVSRASAPRAWPIAGRAHARGHAPVRPR
jgi:hypothetical protein